MSELLTSRVGRDAFLWNQYGFIKTRTIQDCLSWTFEYLHICHKTKKER